MFSRPFLRAWRKWGHPGGGSGKVKPFKGPGREHDAAADQACAADAPLVVGADAGAAAAVGGASVATLALRPPSAQCDVDNRAISASSSIRPCAPSKKRSPLPPRPSHHVLRPDVDSRIDSSVMIRFDPPEHLRTGCAILVLPGGNYEHVCMDKEGQQVAVWLNGLGITAFVLRYRCIPEGHYWPAQLEDFELAMHQIRSHATAWRVDRDRIGVLGFSAGGHLAAMGAVSSDPSIRPEAQILVYPTIDVTKPEWWPWRAKQGFPPPEDSPHLLVGPNCPPAFLAVSSEDGLCTAEENTEPYAEQLRASGVPVQHFVKPMGEHGHGLKGGWTEACEAWLTQIGWTAWSQADNEVLPGMTSGSSSLR